MSCDATNWGLVELDLLREVRAQIDPDFAKYVRSALSETRADEVAKGYNTIFTVSTGSRAARTGKGGGGYIQLGETWGLKCLIYAQDGRVDDEARFGAKGIHAVAALVKGVVNGYTPNDQVDNDGFLELVADEPVTEYQNEAGTVGHKIRQVYALRSILNTHVVGAAAA